MSQGPEEPSTLVHRRLDRTQLALLLVAFWVGFNLRAPILGVPPVLALVRRSDHLSYAVAGLVSAVPILALGLAALPGAALVRRLGAFKVVAIGLAVAAVGELARALPGGVATLLLATAVTTAAQLLTPKVVEDSTYPFVDGLPSAGSKKPVALYAAVPMGAEPSRTEPEPKMP